MQDLNVTLVQSNLHWEDVDANLEMFSEQLEGRSTDLVVLPEMFSTGFTMNVAGMAQTMEGKTMQWMAERANEWGAVVTGSVIIEETGKHYNRMVWMRPDGTHGHYDKRHLFRMLDEDKDYSQGSQRVVVELNGWRVCLQVCYDLRFPVFSRNKEDYDALLYVANWPTPRVNAWSALLVARAIENQCYVAGVNRVGEDGNGLTFSGCSAAIDPKGEELTNIPQNQDCIEQVIFSWQELETFRQKFPVAMDADDFEVKG